MLTFIHLILWLSRELGTPCCRQLTWRERVCQVRCQPHLQCPWGPPLFPSRAPISPDWPASSPRRGGACPGLPESQPEPESFCKTQNPPAIIAWQRPHGALPPSPPSLSSLPPSRRPLPTPPPPPPSRLSRPLETRPSKACRPFASLIPLRTRRQSCPFFANGHLPFAIST